MTEPDRISVQRSAVALSAGADRIRDEWFPVARTTDVEPGRWRPFELLDERWVLACDNSGLIVASPVTETTCVVWRSTVVHDAGADLDAQRAFNELIFSQDIDVVESQRPRRLPVDPRMESHQGADAGSLAYRRWLRARGIRYGTIDTDDADRTDRSP